MLLHRSARSSKPTVILCIVMEYVPCVQTTLLAAYNLLAAQPLAFVDEHYQATAAGS